MDYFLVFILATGCGLLATFTARAIAIRIGLVDKPDGRRKIQTHPVAIAGGIGVLLGTLTALGAASILMPKVFSDLSFNPVQALSFLASAVIIVIVGMIDDLVNLRARYKLIGQIVAAAVLIGPGGLYFDQISLFGTHVALGPLAIPATVFWLLATINALNLLDGMDGFLGTVGMICCIALAFMASNVQNHLVMWVMLAMAGSILGFLRFNFPPASVYLGDCGSMLIGLVVGASALLASLKGPTVAILGPACLLVLPMIDTTAAVVRRKLTGRGLAQGDRGHLHHVLRSGGLTIRRALALAAALGCVAAGGALGATFMQNDLFAVVAAFSVVLILLAGGLFGNAEWRLLRERVAVVVKKASRDRMHVELEVRLQGSFDWGAVWQEVTRAAEDLNLHTVCLDVNAPVWHEGYHRRLDRLGKPQSELKQWKVDFPLIGNGQVIGRLSVTGSRDDVPLGEKMRMLSEIVEAAEVRATEITQAALVPPGTQTAPKASSVPLPTPA